MSTEPGQPTFRSRYTAAAVLCVAGICAYANSFGGAFVLDDIPSIVENPRIHSLWPLSQSMWGPPLTTITGRPFVCLTLAFNHLISGLDIWSYHALNLLIHLAAGLTLFGILRRTLSSDALRARFGPASTGLAFSAALLWLLHPLQTESVTYVIQRSESLMGLFVLVTVYAAIRRWEWAASPSWSIVAVLSCALAMASKETAVVAPLFVLLYDRTFAVGSFGAALKRSPGLYLGLGATWLLLAYLVATGGTAAGAKAGQLPVTAWQYLSAQAAAILHYLRLSIWPVGLCLDYAWTLQRLLAFAWLGFLVLVPLALFTVWSLWRNRPAGVLCAFFFLTLAPTSSLLPLPDLVVEHRMYLPLAAVLVTVVLLGYAALRRLSERTTMAADAGGLARGLSIGTVTLAALVLGLLTFQRNDDYQSAESIWADTVRKSPENIRARYNLSIHQLQNGKPDEALTQLQALDKLQPRNAKVQRTLGMVYLATRRFPEAIGAYRQSLEIEPEAVDVRLELSNALLEAGEAAEAIRLLTATLEAQPDLAPARLNLGIAFLQAGQLDQAEQTLTGLLGADPQNSAATHHLGLVLLKKGKPAEALKQLREAVRLRPNWVRGLAKLAWVLATHPDDGVRDAGEALRLSSQAVDLSGASSLAALDAFAAAHAEAGKFDKAVEIMNVAVQIATAQRGKDQAAPFEQRLESYRQHKPHREAP